MQLLYDWLVELYRQDQALPKAILAGVLVSIACGVIGCFIVLRRTSFLADAISHSMLAGVVAGYLFMKLVFGTDASAPAMLLGAVLSGLVTVVMVGLVTRFSRVKEDTVIGVMYTGIFALGGMLASVFSKYIHIDLLHFLMGQLLAIDDSGLWMIGCVTAAVLAFVILLYRPLQLVSFDRVMAASIGVPVLLLDYLLTGCTSLVVVSGVNVVGIVLVVALLITPAATAYLLFDRLGRMLFASAGFGVSAFFLGIILSRVIGAAPGSTIVVAAAGQFLLVLAIAPRYGLIADLLRRQNSIPQALREDVLGSILRGEEEAAPLARVMAHVNGSPRAVRRAVRSLQRQDLVDQRDGHVSLTEKGRHEAMRLLRAHRLWESYLQHVGEPAEDLHAAAHVLEHVHDEETVDYLDDKLGHPLLDPHGSVIPEDFVHLVPGSEVKASLLREGRRGTVTVIGPRAAETHLRLGTEITAGPRSPDGAHWTFRLPNEDSITLDHDAADDVTVRLEE